MPALATLGRFWLCSCERFNVGHCAPTSTFPSPQAQAHDSRVKPARMPTQVLRFMDWMETGSDKPYPSWAQRATPQSDTQSRTGGQRRRAWQPPHGVVCRRRAFLPPCRSQALGHCASCHARVRCPKHASPDTPLLMSQVAWPWSTSLVCATSWALRPGSTSTTWPMMTTSGRWRHSSGGFCVEVLCQSPSQRSKMCPCLYRCSHARGLAPHSFKAHCACPGAQVLLLPFLVLSTAGTTCGRTSRFTWSTPTRFGIQVSANEAHEGQALSTQSYPTCTCTQLGGWPQLTCTPFSLLLTTAFSRTLNAGFATNLYAQQQGLRLGLSTDKYVAAYRYHGVR